MKDVIWMGTSKSDWDAFPASAQDQAGYQLDKVQRGEAPSDWKPMAAVGPGVCELRIRDEAGAFRAIYLATRPEGVYVLHVFQKKTQKTAKADLDLAIDRFRSLPGKEKK